LQYYYPFIFIIYKISNLIGDDTWENMLLVISNSEDAIKKLQKYVKLGTEIVLTNSSPNIDKLVKLVEDEIAPSFRNYNNRSSD
jgi:spore coat polysaccharide biosynthesis predicted glycosyltransferase SpsG